MGAPQSFKDEATLHGLIRENPQLFLLAGSISLTVLGSKVQLRNGYAGILAVESSSRPTIIEVMLGRNSSARGTIANA